MKQIIVVAPDASNLLMVSKSSTLKRESGRVEYLAQKNLRPLGGLSYATLLIAWQHYYPYEMQYAYMLEHKNKSSFHVTYVASN